MEDMRIGLSMEQLQELEKSSSRIGIDIKYDTKMGQWIANPGDLIYAFCAVAGIELDKGFEYFKIATSAIAFKKMLDNNLNTNG